MSRISMRTTHHLGRAEAQRRLKQKLRVARDDHARRTSELNEKWTDDTLAFGFKTFGVSVVGEMVVDDTEVRLVANVPFHMVIFERLIERRIRAELGNLLS